MQNGRIAAYMILPGGDADAILAERALLKLARSRGWQYVRFFRERPGGREQWESLLQALKRSEILALLLMSLEDPPGSALESLIPLVLESGVLLLTVREGIDSWSESGRRGLQSILNDHPRKNDRPRHDGQPRDND